MASVTHCPPEGRIIRPLAKCLYLHKSNSGLVLGLLIMFVLVRTLVAAFRTKWSLFLHLLDSKTLP